MSRGLAIAAVLVLGIGLLTSCPPSLPGLNCGEDSDCPTCHGCDDDGKFCFYTGTCPGGSCLPDQEACCTGCWLDGVCLAGDGAEACGLGGVDCASCQSGSACAAGICGPPRVRGLALMDTGSCVLRNDGTVWCLGSGNYGQFGNGMTGSTSIPRQVLRADIDRVLEGVVELSAKNSVICARDDAGGGWCWGYGSSGQLGHGQAASSSRAVAVRGADGRPLDQLQQISVGGNHVCARREDGQAWCWGDNGSGRLGRGPGASETYLHAVPMLDSSGATLNTVKQVEAGIYHSCVLLEDDTVQCVGHNQQGQLGDDSTDSRELLVTVLDDQGMPLQGVAEIAVGEEHCCARLVDGGVRCWGRGDYGSIGDGASTDQHHAVAVDGLEGTVGLALGENHSCAVLDDGTAHCWGYNNSSQIGDGTTETRSSPVPVYAVGTELDGRFAALAAGSTHSCALDLDGGLWCWGSNSVGQLGADVQSQGRLAAPQRVETLPAAECRPQAAVSIGLGAEHSCAIDDLGRGWCWGANLNFSLGTELRGFRAWTSQPVVTRTGGLGADSLAQMRSRTGSASSCALDDDGGVWCWGRGSDGQLGGGSSVFSTGVRVEVIDENDVPIAGVRGLSVGGEHVCVVLEDSPRSALCWGSDDNDQLGNGSGAGSQNRAAAVLDASSAPLTGVDQIAAGFMHSCALLDDGQLFCWGEGSSGRLGNGTTDDTELPVAVEQSAGLALDQVSFVALGYSHSCALRAAGELWCWGDNEYSQLGDDSTVDRDRPVQVDIAAASALALGRYHSCAILEDSSLWCWGSNSEGQLGDGSLINRATPVPVLRADGSALDGMVAVAAGNRFTCAIDVDAGLWCWGYNNEGQLGSAPSELPFSTSPVPVALGCR